MNLYSLLLFKEDYKTFKIIYNTYVGVFPSNVLVQRNLTAYLSLFSASPSSNGLTRPINNEK